MQIRETKLEDAYGIAKVHVDSWLTTYRNIVPNEYLNQLTYEKREQLWKKNITEGPVFVAENNEGKIVGFSSGDVERSGNYKGYQGELYAIYLLQNYQGQGLGKRLLKPVVELLKKKDISSMLVLVLEENPSKAFYEAMGAKKIDTLQIEVKGKKLNEDVYGWGDISKISL